VVGGRWAPPPSVATGTWRETKAHESAADGLLVYLRLFVLLGIGCATLWHGGLSRGRSDADHIVQVRELAAAHLTRRYEDRFPGDSIQVKRGASEGEFIFAAPVELEGGQRGTISGVARWNGVVYEIDPRVRIR
jgi:hypothetical protein